MRYILNPLSQFVSNKMVMVTGPRQSGKTTLALKWLEGKKGLYLNYDIPEDRKRILSRDFLSTLRPYEGLVLDEIHKYKRWRALLKGFADKYRGSLPAVITGSGRLDYYRRSGDSLLGRYEHLHLHPFSIGELSHGRIPPPPLGMEWLTLGADFRPEDWSRLKIRSGFPEPYSQDETLHHTRWSNRYRDLLVKEDLRELTGIRTLSLVEHLSLLLPERVGAPFSLNSVREDLSVSYDAAKLWVNSLEKLYYCFRLPPYHRQLARSLKKEPKLYLWDWTLVPEEGARFENIVAGHLLKTLDAWNDLGHGRFCLHYYRNRDGREVDFLIANSGRPVLILECKSGDPRPSENLLRLREELGAPPACQLVDIPGCDEVRKEIRVVHAARFLAALA